jgi:hypothetical protein
LFPAVKYEPVKFTLGPITNSKYAGYGPEVDRAWDYIANDGKNAPLAVRFAVSAITEANEAV